MITSVKMFLVYMLFAAALLGCNDPGGHAASQDPCAGVSCSNQGECVPENGRAACRCNRGYYHDDGECLPIVYGDAGTGAADEGVAALDMDAVDTGVDLEPDSWIDEPYCIEQECLTATTYSCNNGKEIVVYECESWQRCVDGACATGEEEEDPNCGPGIRSICEVTDEFDFVEEEGHDFTHTEHDVDHDRYFQTTEGGGTCGSRDGYLCAEDDAICLFAIYDQGTDSPIRLESWAAFTMRVNPPPEGSYYRLDVKTDWLVDGSMCTDLEDCLPVLNVMFGDEQLQSQSLAGEHWEDCIFNVFGVFSAAGVRSNGIRIQIQNVGEHYHDCCVPGDVWHHNRIAVAKVRVWSCLCVD